MIYPNQYDKKLGHLASLDLFPALSEQDAEEARLRMELPLAGHCGVYEVVSLEVKSDEELCKSQRR